MHTIRWAKTTVNQKENRKQFQDALEAISPTWVEIELGQAAELLRAEGFVARPNDGCRYCSYQLVCPSQRQGEQVVP